jgi:hypothetical protein
VWIPDDHNGYTAGWVVKTEGEIATVALESGEEVRNLERAMKEAQKGVLTFWLVSFLLRASCSFDKSLPLTSTDSIRQTMTVRRILQT